MKRQLCALVIALSLSAWLAACTVQPAPSSSPTGHSGSHNRVTSGSSRREHYTQADYQIAASFRTEDYQTLSVEAFNRKVLDWEDENAYHQVEDAFQRLLYADDLPEDDPNADFFHTTLRYTWEECSVLHYNACTRSSMPEHSGSACYERYGDIYGDQVLVAGGYAEYWFDYALTDPAQLTVGERDALFQKLDDEMSAYLSGKKEETLKQEETMKKDLLSQLNRLLSQLDAKQITAVKPNLSYWWDPSYGASAYGVAELFTEEGQGESTEGNYTKEQYNQLIQALQTQGWQNQSVADFNRAVHTAFTQDNEQDYTKSISYFYELVLSSIPDSDPNAQFLRQTVSASLEEYQAKAAEVYSGKPCDPTCHGWAVGHQQADVFGEAVQVSTTEAGYSFTYRILKPENLTVAERDQFLQAVHQGAQDSTSGDKLTQQAFQAALEKAGAAASSDKIQFTGCKVSYFESWSEY